MRLVVSDSMQILATDFSQRLVEMGPLNLICHFLFVASVVGALVTILRRAALPWMLFMSCWPFIWASAAAHVGFISALVGLDASAPRKGKLRLSSTLSVCSIGAA